MCGNRFGGLVIVDGHPHQFGAGAGQSGDLPDGAVNIGGVGVGHGLHHNWCIAADANPADRGGISLSALNLSHNRRCNKFITQKPGSRGAGRSPDIGSEARNPASNEMELQVP